MIKIGRNDPCPCGSGKKYKHCCSQHGKTFAADMVSQADSTNKALQSALEHHMAGRLPKAEAIYQQILQIAPEHPNALHLSGVLAGQMGKKELAIELISKAILLKPDYAGAHNNLGTALLDQGKLDAAIKSYRTAISINPDLADAHNNLGTALHEQGKLDEAIEHYRRALALNPDYADAHYNLGVTFYDQGKFDAAVESYRRAISINPNYAEAHYNLGNTLKKQGLLDEAAGCYHKALALKPDYAEAHCNLGTVFKEHGNLYAATQCFLKAITLKPNYAIAHCNLGNVFHAQGKLDEAVEHYHKALLYKPDFAEAYSNLLFFHAYHALLDPHAYLAQARGWELACVPAQDRQAAHARIFQRLPLAGRRLRVGYVSGDYWTHAVSYFVEQLFARHDRTRIELFAYSTHSQRDAVTERLQASVEHWVSLAEIPDAASRERIEADNIDVLIDLSGHTAHNRLGVFACRAAPVQAHYLGFMGSTGLTEMDYWLGDEVITPPETDSHFSEQVWRLPRVWVSYEGKADAPLPGWRPSQDGAVWLGSFNNLGKLTPATLALWAKILRALPEGKLLLKTKELADAGNRQRILDSMASHGISPDRIELQDRSATTNWSAHMAYYDRLDIALDPVGGVGGGTTTCDALWMGVQVITLEGDRMASRMTASMLNAIGHPEWIARSEAEYVDKVVALARDVERRKALRPVQRDQMAHSPLCDAQGLARDLESAYCKMFERWLAKQNRLSPLIP